ncbi:MAG: hypothetical protein JXR63_09825 [Spirochaetales bacterium]|nr:hypothetical protein [Spirochaetales bacterium]
MKRLTSMVLLFVLLFISCPGSKGPEVVFKSSAVKGLPGTTIEFDASESSIVGSDELKNCRISVFDSDGNELGGNLTSLATDVENFGIYSHKFLVPGNYVVKASLSDFKLRVTDAIIDVEIESFFAKHDSSLSLGFSKVYESFPITFNPGALDFSNAASFRWEVKNQDSVVVLESDLKTFYSPNGIADVGVYTAYFSYFDAYGNPHTLSQSFEVISSDSPLAVFGIDGEEFYEYQDIVLDATGTSADGSGQAANSLDSLTWYISKKSSTDEFFAFCDPIIKTEVGGFGFSLDSAGEYMFELEVVNSLGLKSSADPLILEVKENTPLVEGFSVNNGGSNLYEGKPVNLTVTADSDSTARTNGEIESVILDFGDQQFVHDVTEGGTEFTFDWIPPFDPESSDTKIYSGNIFVVNKAGRVSPPQPIAPSLTILSNTPVANLLLNGEAFFHGNDVIMRATGSFSPVVADLEFITIEVVDVTDPDSPIVVLEPVDVTLNPSQNVIYSLPPGNVGLKKYNVICTVQNASGSVSSIKEITAEDPYLMAAFVISPDPFQTNVYAKTPVQFDASSSKTAIGTLPSSFAWSIEKILYGELVEDVTSNLNGNPLTGVYSITFSDPGTYRIRLIVSDGVSDSQPLEKVINIKNNVPKDLVITRSDDGAGNYSFTGAAISPDGSALTYKWYVDEYPASSIVLPKGEGTSFSYEFISGDHIVYLAVKNSYNEGAVVFDAFTAKDLEPAKAPTVSGPTPVADPRPQWSWVADDGEPVAKFRYFLAVDNDTSSISWTETADQTITNYVPDFDLANGLHTLYVQAQDVAGNWPDFDSLDALNTGSFEIEVDFNPPADPVVSGIAVTNNAMPTWSWDTPDGAVGFRYQLNGQDSGSWSATVTDTSYTPVSDLIAFGTEDFTLYVQAVSLAGAWSDSGSYTICVDLDPPSVPDVTTLTPVTNNRTPAWEFEGPVDDIVGYRLKVDDEAWLTIDDLGNLPASVVANGGGYVYTRPANMQLSADSPDGDAHVLYVQALDSAGNWGSSGQRAIIIDTTPLDKSVVTITGSDFTKDRTPSWEFSGTSDVVAFSYRFNTESGEWTEAIEYEIPSGDDLADGSYKIYVRALDAAGNWSLPNEFTTVVDNVVPILSFATPHTATLILDYNSAQYTISTDEVNASDTLSGIDTLEVEYISYPVGYSAVDTGWPGEYIARFTTTDRAGNVTTLDKTITVLPPVIDLSSFQLVKPLYVEQNLETTYTATGAVGNTVNSFGGNIVYKWTITGAANYIDPTPFSTSNTRDISLNANYQTVSLSLEIAYADFETHKVTYNLDYTVYPSVVVPNGDFENPTYGGQTHVDTIYPWLWDVDYKWAAFGNGTSTDDIQDTFQNRTDNNGWEWICSWRSDEGVDSSGAARFFDTRDYNPGWPDGNIQETAGSIYSPAISVVAGVPHRLTARVKRSARSATAACRLYVEGLSGLEFSSQSTVGALVDTGADVWHTVDFTFTPDADGTLRVVLFRGGESWNNYSFIYGNLYLDNVDIGYAE